MASTRSPAASPRPPPGSPITSPSPAPPEPRSRPLLRNHHILELPRLVVDADLGRRDPAGELAGLLHRLHQLGDELTVRLRGQPLILLPLPGGGVDQFAQRGGAHVAELADL